MYCWNNANAYVECKNRSLIVINNELSLFFATHGSSDGIMCRFWTVVARAIHESNNLYNYIRSTDKIRENVFLCPV